MNRAVPMATVVQSALAIMMVLMLAVGAAPIESFAAFLHGTFGSPYAFGQVLFRTTPLLLTGLAVMIPLQAGLFNIGAEGQVIVGAFAAAWCGAALPVATPSAVAIPLCLGAAALGGASVGGVIALFRVVFDVHEVISGLLCNLIVRAVMVGIGTHFFLRESVHTAPIIPAAHLPRLSAIAGQFAGSAANVAFFFALTLTLIVPWWSRRSRLGFLLRAVGENSAATQAAGHPVARLRAFALVAGGALAGLASSSFVLGYKYYYEDGFSGGVGFVGLAVAILGRGRARGIFYAALLFGVLGQGGLAVNSLVPREVVDIVQAVLLAGAAVALAQGQKRETTSW